MSPYEMLYARQPLIPPAVYEQWEEPLDLDDPVRAAELVLARAQLARQHETVAAANLRIAQHRDTLRYAHTHSGKFVPRLVRFQVGDYVYMRATEVSDTLQIAAKPTILRIKELKPDGMVVLQGRCGSTTKCQVSNLAPCHLPGIDGTIDPAVSRFDAAWCCEVCSLPSPEHNLLLCDWCNCAWHTDCLRPPLAQVPEGIWVCPYCVDSGVTAAQVEQRQSAADALAPAAPDLTRVLHPSTSTKHRDRRAAQLHGRLLVRRSKEGRGVEVPRWGRVVFTSPEHRPAYFKVVYEDGSVYINVTYTQVKKLLMPEGTLLPVGVVIPTLDEAEQASAHTCSVGHVLDPMVGGPAVADVPPELLQDKLTREFLVTDVQEVLREHLGSSVPVGIAREVCGALCWLPDNSPYVGWDARQFWPLAEAIDLSLVRGIADPFFGSAQMVAELVRRGKLVVTCQAELEGATGAVHKVYQEAFWQQLVAQHCIDIVISRPIPGVLDIVLPLALRYVPLVCALVPARWVENPHTARRAWMQQLSANQLLHVVATWPDDLQGERCVWVCLFRNQAVHRQAWRRAQV